MCESCPFVGTSQQTLDEHMEKHVEPPDAPFKCYFCSFYASDNNELMEHMNLHGEPESGGSSTTFREEDSSSVVYSPSKHVLMTYETGRQNYSKYEYNKYLTTVHEPAGESSGGKKVTQSFEPIRTIPAPPKLTPGPQSSLQGENYGTPSNGSSRTYRRAYSKPPPLLPAYDMKRKNADDSEDEPPKKKGPLENKKTMWKCKKCLFRNSDQAVVFAHVKEHHRTQSLQAGNDTSDERHCRLKNNGDVEVVLAPQHNPEEQERTEDENEAESFMCESCPFVGTSQQTLDEHMEKHVEPPDAPFKCYFCSFYVSDNNELMEHMSLHGEPESGGSSTTFREEDSSSVVYSPSKHVLMTDETGRQNYSKYEYNKYLTTVQEPAGESSGGKKVTQSFEPIRTIPAPPKLTPGPQSSLQGENNGTPSNGSSRTYRRAYSKPPPLLPAYDMKRKNADDSGEPPKKKGPLENKKTMWKCKKCLFRNSDQAVVFAHVKENHRTQSLQAGNDTSDENTDLFMNKHYRCSSCPYVTNIEVRFLYHIQFHRPLGAPFQCHLCSFNVPLRDFLEKHLRLHGINTPLPEIKNSGTFDPETPLNMKEIEIRDLNTLLSRKEGPPKISPVEINKDSSTVQSTPDKDSDSISSNVDKRLLHFCSKCPARFLSTKELKIHMPFHSLFQCDSCSYTARQQPYLQEHYKVHTDKYQDRTTALCKVYQISEENPKPKTTVIVDGSKKVGPAWVVVERQKLPAKDPQNKYDVDEAPSEVSQHGNRIACDKCPATFTKAVALQHHSTLHGGPGPHKCRVCDYAVKNFRNLIKHESFHKNLEPRAKFENKSKKAQENIPTSRTELFKQKTEANQKVAAAPPPPPAPLHIDPEFGILMHGSPEFIYPTYLKDGRLKEKRYKCHKCPSAFEKREQYKVHLSLHGSKQRYSCERCDYSVKFYANYIQHLRKHQSNDVCHQITDEILPQPPISSRKRSGKKVQLSIADQQETMLMQHKVISNSMSAPKIINRCPQCPYSNQRKDGVESHVKCHSNVKGGAFACKYCDYTVPQQHVLRKHTKLHFSPLKSHRPEAYMKLDRLELWSEPVVNNDEDKASEDKPKKELIFKDRGVNVKEDRFLPVYSEENSEQPEDEKEIIYINMKTGEEDNSNSENSDSSEKEDVKEGAKLNTADQNNLTANSVSSEIPATSESNM